MHDMKKYITIFYIILVGAKVAAQPDYPSAPAPVTNLVKLEYFIDNDPGAGNGIPVSLAASSHVNLFSFNASLSGVANGFHRIYLRSMDAGGKWSHAHNAFFDNFVVPAYAIAPAAAGSITEAEFFIDTDPGPGNGNKIIVTPGQDIIDELIAVNISGLPSGVHRLYIRSKDAHEKWSLTYFALFDNSTAIPYPVAADPAPPIGEIEYYIDADPGFGNATPVTFTAATNIANLSIEVPLNGIAAGPHTLYIRSKQNPWSLSAYVEFTYASTLPVTWLYVKGEISNNTALLSWASATEENTDKFVVEHSVDGRLFALAAQVASAGSSSSPRQYSFRHNGLQPGMNYYRIRELDKDGRYTLSQVITLMYRDNLRETLVAPNPVKDMLYIVEPVKKWVERMELYDLNGRLLFQKNIEAENILFNLPTNSLLKGAYILKVLYSNEYKTFRIVKE
jgi:hypothetical protein